jgi:uncharacterized membrane protein
VPARALPADAPRRDRLWLPSVVLSIIGLGVAGVTAWAKLTNTVTPCAAGVSNCEVVQTSAYAYVGPVPVAYIGVVGYLAILAVLLLERRVPLLAARGRWLVFAMTLFGFLFSGYLTAIEAFVLREWCQWCVASAVTMTVLFAVSFARLWAAMSALPDDEAEA